MNKNYRFAAVAVFLIGALAFAPLLASAETITSTVTVTSSAVSSLEAQIKALLTQLNSLQAQLNTARGNSASSSPSVGMGMGGAMACIKLERNLSIGSQGSDVAQLQQTLSVSSTGYFGPMTEHAVMEFQEKNGIASSSTGFVGPLTRNFFGGHCPPPMMGSSTHPMPSPASDSDVQY